MKIHRFIGDFDLSQHQLLIKDAELTKQMRNVLKLRTGERMILSTGKGEEALCELGGYGQDSVSVTIIEQLKNDAEPISHVVLYCAVLKRENFEFVVQKATEIGVKEIVPIITERTIKLNLRQDRLEKICKEAAEQSGRAIIPTIRQHLSFEDAISDAQRNAANYMLTMSGTRLSASAAAQGSVGVFIGPEGGWGDREVELARENTWAIVSLGPLTLRAETAAIIASYLFV